MSGQQLVEFRNFEKSFVTNSGPVTAIRDLDLSIADGSFVAIVGPSGCGKSTLLMALAGLTLPTSGSVRLRGKPVDGPVTRAGVVFQGAELLPWRTTLENVMLQAEIRHLDAAKMTERARALLGQVGLLGFEDKYPDELSGGMQQRVSLCRALLHEPDLLLMDEPFGALDAMTRDQIQSDLQQLWMQSSKTVVFITHSIEEAVFLADRVIVLSPRPARIAADLEIDLPRPRHIADRGRPEFVAYVDRLRQEFMQLGVFHDGD